MTEEQYMDRKLEIAEVFSLMEFADSQGNEALADELHAELIQLEAQLARDLA